MAKTKRIWAGLLALIMVVSLLTVPVFAEDTPAGMEVTTTGESIDKLKAGDMVTVKVTLPEIKELAGVEIHLNFSKDMLEYVPFLNKKGKEIYNSDLEADWGVTPTKSEIANENGRLQIAAGVAAGDEMEIPAGFNVWTVQFKVRENVSGPATFNVSLFNLRYYIDNKPVPVPGVTAPAPKTVTIVTDAPKPAKLTSIAVTKNPSKLEYEVGESFNKTGMEVTATYSDGTEKVVTGYTTDAPATFKSAGTNKITIKYTEGGETRQTILSVTVKEKSPEALTGTVKINGKAVYNETLTASLEDGNNTGTLSYKWFRDGAEIPGATDSTHKLVEEDVGKVIKVQISAADKTGTLEATTEKVKKAIPKVVVTLATGLVANGSEQALVTKVEKPEGCSNVQFSVNEGKVSYGLPTATDPGTYAVYYYVHGNTVYEEIATTKAGEVTIAPAPAEALTGTVKITGKAVYNETLTATLESGNNTGTLSYKWYRGEDASEIAEGESYKVVADDIGSTLTCVVSSSVQSGEQKAVTAKVEKAAGPGAPNVTAEAATASGKGKINGTTTLMEYHTDAAATSGWQSCSAAATEVDPCTYYVRFKETTTHKAGESKAVTVASYVAPAVPSATVADVTITGTVGKTFNDQNVTITLVNDEFKDLPPVGGSVKDLFPDLTGTLLIAKLESVNKGANQTVLTATISGVADKEVNTVMHIVIPADRLKSGKALPVTENPNAKFAITKDSVPTSLKICKADGTAVTTDTLTAKTTPQDVKYTAKVYDQYDNVLPGSYTVNWALTPSGSLSMSGSNPTQQMSLQLAANASAGTYTLEAALSGTEIKASITISVVQPKAELLTAPPARPA